MRTLVPSSGIGHPTTPWRVRIRRALRVIRSIIGEPDYERYVAHMESHHPECAVMSRDDFMSQRLESRYSRPGSRCC